MDDIISKLKTPEQCIQLAKNVIERNPNLAKEARRRAVELRAIAYGSTKRVEVELLKALYAYEEVLTEKNKKTTRASRTWQMIKKYGIINAAERAVNRPIEPNGYKVLVQMGMQDLTFESVIVHYPDAFNEEVVVRAQDRLKKLLEV